MKCFHCESCGAAVFFQNNHCLKCDHPLGFLPDQLVLSALEEAPDRQWRGLSPQASGRTYRHCANDDQYKVCNWMVPASDPNPLCAACRLNEIIPNLADGKNLERWAKLELAKRHWLYTLLRLGLTVESQAEGKPTSLRFRLLQDQPNSPPVLTGHADGIITINIAEADDDEREHRRLTLHEPYRTTVGHLRHESGHYYWDRLIASSPELPRFRELFGDETADYDAALQTYYKQGPPAGWPERTVTAYGSSHPWEDWAETWAHYMHIMETLETAASFGLGLKPDPGAKAARTAPVVFSEQMDFDALLASWIPLTCALNSINRGMGLPDLYPFVIPPAVVEKLRFIHQMIGRVRLGKPPAAAGR